MTFQIEIDQLNKYYSTNHVLRDICMQIPKGQFVALVGPSGCGKSTLLRTIAGLETAGAGKIFIEGAEVTGKAPRERDLAMVFQSYALYPHMTVRKNLTYALRLKRQPKEVIDHAVKEISQITGLEELLDRFPRELSGGQRQRVAMGRAIIRNPSAFLFDEPLSNLDAALRVHMRAEIRKLHQRLGATSVYVTHDQIEAMTMADHVVVMRNGRIEQQGAPLTLYDRPTNRFVAGFIGSPAMNFLPATVAEDGVSVRLELPGAPVLQFIGRRPAGEAVMLGLRPEHLMPEEGIDENRLSLPVNLVERTGSACYVMTNTDPEIVVAVPSRVEEDIKQIGVTIAPEHVHLFSRDASGTALLNAA
ncbi:ABC transporter ATP-binding protein [Kushneria indalinina]|uniref:Carbohydrate ABC transporter ATP-binding protein (CUT1 family) n=1 Tax=Kushneria indalinina DSM 14324 TaxID=1122140 RepID=A0A3D9DYX4_9GAMM|nr:sn-glycerol-3-phosphate ABC transporter ATP-binding protein UgpC [Kushneria indalinina]REC95875.1 carbohydrate ABC transporter ATP-binding protein (CUT1 family) [Kushneria indalinina DSM 14324]